MKRLLLIFAFCLLFAGCGKQNTHDNTVVIDMTSEGLFLPCADGNYMAIFDNYGPVELHTGNDDYSVFDGLTVGDRVRVNHGILLETYPASTGITGIEKLADGSREDIPEDVIASLEELGRKIWPDEVPEEKQGKSTLSYLYPYSEEEMPIEFFEPNGDGTLPFDYDYETGVCVIHDSEDIIFTLDDPWMEKAIKVSEGMYLFTNCCGHGTGCQMEELYRLQAPDYVPVKVLSYESIVDALNSRINYKYDEKRNITKQEKDEAKNSQ